MDAINALARLLLITVSAITLYVVVMLVIFFMRRKGWLPGGKPSTRTLGSGFLHLQSLTRPETQYVLEETDRKRKEEEDEGGPDDPTRHIKRRSNSDKQ